MKAILSILLLATGIAAGTQLEHQHNLEERAKTAARTLRSIYALTPSESIRIVSAVAANSGNICLEYVEQDAREQSSIRYAVLEKGSKTVNYDLDQEDLEGRCSMSGVDLTNIAEEELEEPNKVGAR